jgi:hypothetical protein
MLFKVNDIQVELGENNFLGKLSERRSARKEGLDET